MKYTLEQRENYVKEVCRIISTTGLGIKKACNKAGVTYPSFWRWLSESDELGKEYQRANLMRADILHSQCLEIADKKSNDIIKSKVVSEGVTYDKITLNSVAVARAKLQIETRLKMVSQMNPAKYGANPLIGTDQKSITAISWVDSMDVSDIKEIDTVKDEDK